MFYISLVILGVLFLYLGAELLVRSSCRLALFFGLSPMIVGLTILAFATSMPETISAVVAQLQQNASDIVMGDVIGSNIANIGLIGCLVLAIFPQAIPKQIRYREMPVLLASALFLTAVMAKGQILRSDGLILLLMFLGIFALQFFLEKKNPHKVILPTGYSHRPIWDLLLLAGGILLLFGGAYALIKGAIGLASWWGVQQRIIALIVVAIGTSLPEMATSLVAAIRHEKEMAIGNLIGSNIFNGLFIIAIASFVQPLTFSRHFFNIDVPVMFFFMFFLWMLSFVPIKMVRSLSIAGLIGYLGYISFLL